jgi:uncharacterized protein YjiS (DUF1127 family)
MTSEEDRIMTQSLNSFANHNADRAGAAPGDRGVAGALRNLAYAAIRPLRYRMHYHKIFGELASLDDEVLHDIGLAPWDIGTYAHQRAGLRWPVRASLKASLSEVAAALWRAVERGRERRRAYNALMMLDDRGLKDIGLHRSQVPWIIDALVRHASDFDDIPTARRPARDVERAGVGRKPSRTPASFGAVTASDLERPANDDRMRRAS